MLDPLINRRQEKTVTFQQRLANPDMNGVFDVMPAEVAELAQAQPNQICLVDVREPNEFTGELGHVADSRLVVLNSILDQLETLPKDKTIVFICKSGGRSARAAAYAQANGYSDVYNMRGGMLLWNSLRLPVSQGT